MITQTKPQNQSKTKEDEWEAQELEKKATKKNTPGGSAGSRLELHSQWLADKLRYSGHGSVLQCCWCVSEQTASLHDGSINHRLYVVPPVARVDYSLSLWVLDDLSLLKDAIKSHVWCFRLQRQNIRTHDKSGRFHSQAAEAPQGSSLFLPVLIWLFWEVLHPEYKRHLSWLWAVSRLRIPPAFQKYANLGCKHFCCCSCCRSRSLRPFTGSKRTPDYRGSDD